MSDNVPLPPDEVLPCGCVFRCAVVEQTKVLTVIPCRSTCTNYRTVLSLAAESGKPVEHGMAP